MGAGIEGTFDIWPFESERYAILSPALLGLRSNAIKDDSFHARSIMFNLEINNTCSLTSVCGDSCFLNARDLVDRETLETDQIIEAATEVIINGRQVRHFVFAGKEPLESPGILFEILQRYHAAPTISRPGTTAFITASATQLQKLIPRFTKLPVTTCLISADTADASLHFAKNNNRLLDAALQLRDAQGAEFITVLTVLTSNNLKAVIELGKHLFSKGIDQWSIFPFRRRQQGIMVATMSPHLCLDAAYQLADEFVGISGKIVIELDMETLWQLQLPLTDKGWRVECSLPNTNVICIATESDAKNFIRLRFDGEILDHDDLLNVGRLHGTYGVYASGRMAEVIQSCYTREHTGKKTWASADKDTTATV